MHAHYTQTSGDTASHAGTFAWFVRPLTPARAATVFGLSIVLSLLLVPLDRALMGWLGPWGGLGGFVKGDVHRELEFLQQFGAVSSVVIILAVMWLVDPQRRHRAVAIIAAVALNSAVMYVLKLVIGRPRPRVLFHDHVMTGRAGPWEFTLPWGTYPLPRVAEDGTVTYLEAHAWEVWKGISSDLWSVPSSHAGAAACLAAALARVYPRLTPMLVVLMVIVGCARVLLGAHFVSDVVVGWAVGYCVGAFVMERVGRR